MNKKVLFWILGVTAVVIVLLGVLGILLYMQRAKEPTQLDPILFPNTGTATSTSVKPFTIPDQNGNPIQVRDFIHNGETVPDVVNPGTQVLAGSLGYCLADGSCPSGASTTDFSISYDENDYSFNVVLLTEPLSKSRRTAEQFLLSRLGVTQAQLCLLKSYVGVPAFVNETFEGNLGYSFCAKSTKLP
ncbi:MAG: hypothetical protein AB203_00170 [Parcubacteria bacterium C7867-008]|nr:MAG: hypothetical protein AB203_00170 [Parcubacteria bacterium C7867-008]